MESRRRFYNRLPADGVVQRGWRKARAELVEKIVAILRDDNPATLRGIYYALVTAQLLENDLNQYKMLSRLLVEARQRGYMPWEWIDDRVRLPIADSMWDDRDDFAESVIAAYRLNVWEGQPEYFEAWVEKDTLAAKLADVLRPYGVTLNVGRGYDGWTSIRNAADRFNSRGEGHRALTILYFGDFDPSGEDMVRSLQERLDFFGCRPKILKCALTREDIDTYNLPPNPTKAKDCRRDAFIAKHGDMCVELDALPTKVLKQRLKDQVESRLDMSKLAEVEARQEPDRLKLAEVMEGFR